MYADNCWSNHLSIPHPSTSSQRNPANGPQIRLWKRLGARKVSEIVLGLALAHLSSQASHLGFIPSWRLTGAWKVVLGTPVFGGGTCFWQGCMHLGIVRCMRLLLTTLQLVLDVFIVRGVLARFSLPTFGVCFLL